jgi:hypothetical protein
MMLEGLQPPKRVFNCRVRSVLETLDAKDKKIFEVAIQSFDLWPARTLSNALKQRGVVVSDAAISNHRKRTCSCGKIN